MKTKLLTVLFLLILQFSFSQSATVSWAKQFGGLSLSETRSQSTVLDASGNIYIAGTFVGTADFDPGPGVYNLTSAGSTNSVDAYILKLDANGNFLWVKQIENESISQSFSIALDGLGNVYTAGRFEYSADFDPGPGIFTLTANPEGSYLLKLDGNGNFVWAQAFGRNFIDYVTTYDGFIYGSGARNATVSKFDQSGNMLWEKHAVDPTTNGDCHARNAMIALDNLGNIYATGTFYLDCDFDPGSGQFNLYSDKENAYVYKLDNDGNFIFVKTFSGGTSLGASIAVDAVGNILSTGTFSEATDFDPGAGSFIVDAPFAPTVNHAFISKLDAGGNFVWAKAFYGDLALGSNVIKTDAGGNVYTAGYFLSVVDFDPGTAVYNLTAAGGSPDIFLTKLNSSGNLQWAKKMGSCGYDEIFGMAVDAASNIFITGISDYKGGFDGIYFTEPGNTQFIAKLTQSSGTAATVCLGSRVWNDIDRNGIDNNEPGMAGLRVNLYRDDNNDNIADDCFSDFKYTDLTGNYSFCNLTPGNYIVGVALPSGYSNGNVNGGDPDNNIDKDNNGKVIIETFNPSSTEFELRGFSITLSLNGEPGGSSTNNTYDLGLVQGQLCLGNRVWNDINRNGKDNGEPGISDVPVVLYKVKSKTDTISVAVGQPEETGPLMQTSTDANGNYSFCHLFPGYYIVYVYMPEGFVNSKINGGDPDNNKDEDNNGKFAFPNFNSTWGLPITLTVKKKTSRNTNNTYDFGLHVPGGTGCDDDDEEDDDEGEHNSLNTASTPAMEANLTTSQINDNTINAIYPNPFVTEVTIQLLSTENTKATVNIIAGDGKIVYVSNENLVKGGNKLTLTGLKKITRGIYILKIQTGKQIIIKKLVKE